MEFLREHPDISAAVAAGAAALIAAIFYAVVATLRKVPEIIEKRIEQRMQMVEMRQAEIDAEAMRDRAIADSMNMAAAVNSQAMRVIEIMANAMVDDSDLQEDMQGMLSQIKSTNKSLEDLIYLYNPEKKRKESR